MDRCSSMTHKLLSQQWLLCIFLYFGEFLLSHATCMLDGGHANTCHLYLPPDHTLQQPTTTTATTSHLPLIWLIHCNKRQQPLQQPATSHSSSSYSATTKNNHCNNQSLPIRLFIHCNNRQQPLQQPATFHSSVYTLQQPTTTTATTSHLPFVCLYTATTDNNHCNNQPPPIHLLIHCNNWQHQRYTSWWLVMIICSNCNTL